jgi:hypothetical protein
LHECTASFLLYRFLQYMCWERGYDKDKLRKVIGSWKKHNGGRYIGDVPQAIPLTGHRNKEQSSAHAEAMYEGDTPYGAPH